MSAKTGWLLRAARATDGMLRLTVLLLSILPVLVHAQSGVEAGRKLFLDPAKGNCVACHQAPADPGIKGISQIGPVLANVKSRLADRNVLRALIWDPLASRPNVLMPPYGRNRILTDTEIDAIVLYVETL